MTDVTREPAGAWMERLHEVTRSVESIPYTPPEVVADCARWLLMLVENLLIERDALLARVETLTAERDAATAELIEVRAILRRWNEVRVENAALRAALDKVQALIGKAFEEHMSDGAARHLRAALAGVGVPEPQPQDEPTEEPR